MNSLIVFIAAPLLALALVTPARALTVKIETAVPLADHSDETLNLAIRRAVQSAVDGATAMGLTWIWFDDARVLSDAIIVRMVATDEDDERPGAAIGLTF